MKKETSDLAKSDYLEIFKRVTANAVLLHRIHFPQKELRVEEVNDRLHLAYYLH